MSLYERTISFILHYIEEHKLAEGARLPTEPELAAMAGVSMVTVRRALAELAGQAVVRREQGRGTFLARRRVSAETTKPGSLRNGLGLAARSTLETRLLALERRGATAEEAARLAVAEAAAVWEIRRLRLLDGRPMIQEVSVIPMILAPRAPCEKVFGHESSSSRLRPGTSFDERSGGRARTGSCTQRCAQFDRYSFPCPRV